MDDHSENSVSRQHLEIITNVVILASKKDCPEGYYVVAQTTDGCDANLWKDSIFKSKVTRYLCFTRAVFAQNKQFSNVVVDMKLIDSKACVPEGFTPIQDTTDTEEQALRKERLCVKLVPRHSADTAVCDVLVQGKSKHSLANYTFIGELNNLGIWYQLGKVTKSDMEIPSSTIPRTRQFSESPASSPAKKDTARPKYGQQTSDSYCKSAIEDLPFMISAKSTSTTGKVVPDYVLGITIKSPQDIAEEYNYSFDIECSVADF